MGGQPSEIHTPPFLGLSFIFELNLTEFDIIAPRALARPLGPCCAAGLVEVGKTREDPPLSQIEAFRVPNLQ